MRRFAIVMPLFAILAGVAGLYVRMLERRDVFDDFTGLPERGATITYLLIALAVGFLILVAVFSIVAGVKHTSLRGFDNAFGTESLAYPFLITLLGAVWLGATVKYFVDSNASLELSEPSLYFVILSALAALSMVFFAIEIYQDPRRKTALVLSVVPILFMCFWLILLYKENATNPVLLGYCYYCLAVISVTLSFYYTAGFIFNKRSPGKAVFVYLASIFFCLVTLADDHQIGVKLILAAMAAVDAIYSFMLIRHMRKKEISG